jgi:hypothetical protein
LNVYFNNKGKVAWQQLSKLAEIHRLYVKPLSFGVKRAAVAYQLTYTINWFFRLLPLLCAHLSLPIYLASWALFLASIVLSRKFVKDYARRRGFAEADDLEKRWKQDMALIKKIAKVSLKTLLGLILLGILFA